MKNLKKLGSISPYPFKFDLKMKLTIYLFLITLFQVQASIYSQNTKITLKLKNATIEKVLREIESKTEFKILYNDKEVDYDRILSVDFKEEQVSEILKKIFLGTPITFQILGKQIILKIDPVQKQDTSSILETQQPEQIQISGTVLDNKGLPLPGANILEKGTTNGTQSDFDGNFTLALSNQDATLVISYIGFQTKEIPINGQQQITIALEESAAGLDEVVVVGYGTQKKRDIIGSVSTIDAKSITALSNATFDGALQGLASGVSVQSATGVPGAPTKITIRGTNSINSSTDPLWIIDGMPIYSYPFGLGSSEGQNEGNITTGQNPMSLINPNDIESVQVLKDAAATAIYGSRASNGVIIVTTKSGKKGTHGLNVDVSTGVSDLTRTPKDVGYVNTNEWFQVMDRAYANIGRGAFTMDDYYQYAPLAFDKITRQQAEATHTDWFDQTFRNGGFTDLNLSALNGTEKGDYYVSLNYRQDEGVQNNNDLKRLTGRVNLNIKPLNNLKLGIKMNFSYTKNNRSPNNFSRGANSTLAAGGINFLTTAALPWFPIYNPNSTDQYFNPYSGFNGVASTDPDNFLNKLEQYRALGGLFVEYKVPFIKGLTIKSEGSFDIIQSNNTTWVSKAIRLSSDQEPSSYASDESVTYRSINYNVYGTYSKTIEDHTFDIVGGVEAQRTISNRKRITGEDLVGTYQEIGSPNRMLSMFGGITGERYLLAYFGRANYKFKNKYLLGFSIRRDGTSTFTSDYRWGTFTAYSAGWIMSDEEFMSFLGGGTFLKLRGSYGETGNQNIGNGLGAINYNENLNYGGIDIGGVNGTLPANLPVSDLTWEKTKSADLGIDYGFMGNRINGSIALYRKYVSGMLLQSPLPASAGITPVADWPGIVYNTSANRVWSNIGDMVNKGIEFDIHTVNVDEKFKWKTDFNISFNQNEIEKLSSTADLTGKGIVDGSTVSRTGHRRLVWYMADYAGVDAQTGIPMIYELDKEKYNEEGITQHVILPSGEDSKILATNANISNNRFYQDEKSQDPTYYGGLSNTFEYKGFDLSFILSFSGGNYIYDYDEQMALIPSETRVFKRDILENSWRNPGDIAKYPQLVARGTYTVDGTPNSNFGHEWVQYNATLYKGDFIRLKNVQLGYNLPKGTLDKLRISAFRIYVSGTNLLTVTNYPGFDPEGAGYVYSAQIPQLKTFTLGLNVKL